MFLFYAEKNNLTICQREAVTSGSVNIYQAKFLFSPDWDGLTRVAVFKGSGEPVSILLDSSGECVIPWEALTTPDAQLRAGVYGTCDGDVVLPTVWANCGFIHKGVTTGGQMPPTTPELWRQELAHKQDKLTGLPGQVVGFDTEGNAIAQDAPAGGGESGGTIYQFGHGLKQFGNLVFVDVADNFDSDNTRPISAAAVQSVVGDIETLLETI